MSRQTRPLWLVVMCLWAAGMIFEATARTLLLAIGQSPTGDLVFSLTLSLAIIGVVYIAGLAAAVVGMWQRRDWGRKLFLGLITLYYSSLLLSSASQWGPLVGVPLHTPGQGWVTMVLVEGIGGLAFGWWYLNRKRIKAWFAGEDAGRHDV